MQNVAYANSNLVTISRPDANSVVRAIMVDRLAKKDQIRDLPDGTEWRPVITTYKHG